MYTVYHMYVYVVYCPTNTWLYRSSDGFSSFSVHFASYNLLFVLSAFIFYVLRTTVTCILYNFIFHSHQFQVIGRFAQTFWTHNILYCQNVLCILWCVWNQVFSYILYIYIYIKEKHNHHKAQLSWIFLQWIIYYIQFCVSLIRKYEKSEFFIIKYI